MAHNYLNELFSSFPSLVCEKEIVLVMLELLTVLRRSCLSEFLDEVIPIILRSFVLEIADVSTLGNSTRQLTPFQPLTFLLLFPTTTLSDNASCENFTPTFVLGSKLALPEVLKR